MYFSWSQLQNLGIALNWNCVSLPSLNIFGNLQSTLLKWNKMEHNISGCIFIWSLFCLWNICYLFFIHIHFLLIGYCQVCKSCSSNFPSNRQSHKWSKSPWFWPDLERFRNLTFPHPTLSERLGGNQVSIPIHWMIHPTMYSAIMGWVFVYCHVFKM